MVMDKLSKMALDVWGHQSTCILILI